MIGNLYFWGVRGRKKNKMEVMGKLVFSVNIIFYSFILCLFKISKQMQKGIIQILMCHS